MAKLLNMAVLVFAFAAAGLTVASDAEYQKQIDDSRAAQKEIMAGADRVETFLVADPKRKDTGSDASLLAALTIKEKGREQPGEFVRKIAGLVWTAVEKKELAEADYKITSSSYRIYLGLRFWKGQQSADVVVAFCKPSANKEKGDITMDVPGKLHTSGFYLTGKVREELLAAARTLFPQNEELKSIE